METTKTDVGQAWALTTQVVDAGLEREPLPGFERWRLSSSAPGRAVTTLLEKLEHEEHEARQDPRIHPDRLPAVLRHAREEAAAEVRRIAAEAGAKLDTQIHTALPTPVPANPPQYNAVIWSQVETLDPLVLETVYLKASTPRAVAEAIEAMPPRVHAGGAFPRISDEARQQRLRLDAPPEAVARFEGLQAIKAHVTGSLSTVAGTLEGGRR